MHSITNSSFPPQNYLAEEILLGSILINPRIFPQIIPIIKTHSFFLECHQIIYKNLITLNQYNKLEAIQLLYYLSETNMLNVIGGVDKILEIMKQSQIFMPSIQINIYIKEIVNLINDKYIKRLMIQYGHNIIRLAYINNFPTPQLYNRASYYLNSTLKKVPKENLDNFEDLIGDLLINLAVKNRYKTKDIKHIQEYLSSGFQNIDQITGGLSNGDLIVLAGRPSTGKTSLAINIAYNVSNLMKIGICIFSLEMSKMQILQKLISIASSIPSQHLIFKTLNNQEWTEIQNICKDLLSSHMYINDSSNMSIDYIEYTARILKKETQHVELIIIDYLQLIHLENKYTKNRSQELSYITRKLKLLAQDLQVPVIVLSQLNRNIENRQNKQPILSDLRESGCISVSTFIKSEPINQIHIINLFPKYNKFIYHLPKKRNINVTDNKVKIELQYIFSSKITNYNLLNLTYNHKLYLKYKWLQQNMIEENHYFIKSLRGWFNTYILENVYNESIKYKYFNKVYDIEISNYSNLICDDIILHNSIEQDADIVMMLYQDSEVQHNMNKDKILNIFICKNRNGPTGICRLLFNPENTSFITMVEDQL
uniref:Replicative DNA helicase n=1 Tax=Schizymenia dubyi TaxID=38368 RepID=A0A1C9C9K0_9FLOR|nr:replication helicase subunit [Schizymenia dubyi]AOM65045.1 replication helicase subunit [Schizymenia dubyi]